MNEMSWYLLACVTIASVASVSTRKEIPHMHFENEERFRPVGCFKDAIKKEDRALPVLLRNYRTTGELDWRNLKDVVLKCAEEVRKKGWVYFGIQFWGECWSGPSAHVTYDVYGKTTTGCFNDTWGMEFSNFVYRRTGKEHECHPLKYKILDEMNRSVLAGPDRNCDFLLRGGWYRFQGLAGTQMPSTCVAENHCSTKFSGWFRSESGQHPGVLDGIKPAEVCFTKGEQCCPDETRVDIQVRNCGRFYVYKLRNTNACPARYCSNGQPTNSSDASTRK